MKNILITAATGNIGSQIVRVLKEKKIEFYAGISAQDKALNDVNCRVIDYNDSAVLEKAFMDIDTLFLLYPMDEKMINWNKNAIDAARKVGVKHIVRSSGAGSNSGAPFLMPNVQGTIDDYIIKSGINYTITQPAAFMQNFVNFLANDIKNGTVYQPVNGNSKLNWADVRDIASVNAEIIIDPSKYVNQQLTISGGENLSYEDCLKIIGSAIGKSINFVKVSNEAAIDAMLGYQIPQFNIDMMMSLNAIIDLGYAQLDTQTVKDITGKDPLTFKQFATDYKNAWL